MYSRIVLGLLLIVFLNACKEQVRKPTLADIDVSTRTGKSADIYIKPQSEEQVRQAYSAYLRHASKNDRSRMDAITRLAELELEMTEKLLREKDNLASGDQDDIDDRLYDARLEKTVELLETSLKDYPKAKNNHRLLYQLAKVYAQIGEHQKSIQALNDLVSRYPKSPYYAEAQFRLAEDYFSRRDYIGAEDAYTEAITSPGNAIFYEKSLFKRGWARFKQELYTEAVDDYLQAVSQHEFGEIKTLSRSEKEQFDEYFRAIGLAFSYLGGADQLQAYFSSDPSFKYIYYTYSTVSNIYLRQERFSDAVNTLEQFIRHYPQSRHIPYARLSIIDIWKNSGFENRIYAAIETFYVNYNPGSNYWSQHKDEQAAKEIASALQKYVVLIASHYHNRYQKSSSPGDFRKAELWYQRYFRQFSGQAQKDNMYFLYAELLNQNRQYAPAIKYYELAAYDNDIILNKEAAYATIVISDKFLQNTRRKDSRIWLDKHIKYALLFSQLYPLDKRSPEIVLHASEIAFTSGQYEKSIELTNLIPDTASTRIIYQANIIKAQAYFSSGQYAEAETIYRVLINDNSLPGKKSDNQDKLALAIYKQAEAERDSNNIPEARRHFSRISDIVPHSEIAATGLYDAIALSINNQQWQTSIQYISKFQKLYPDHENKSDVSRKLSVAYLKSGQDIKAAQEFEKISSQDNNAEVKMAALWQAAELYEEKKDYNSAIRSYKKYVREHRTRYPQYVEAMHKLVVLYRTTGNARQADRWRQNIIKADNNASRKEKTERTRYLASLSSLEMARSSHQQFNDIRLSLPLKVSLRNKKNAMQSAVKLYGQASVQGVLKTTTEATHAIGSIYGDFSRALLDSDRPDNLNSEELEQYEILLEDQAFPFEEKAIEFYETNLSRVKDGIYNEWIRKSHSRLKKLFPVRYERNTRTDAFVNVFH